MSYGLALLYCLPVFVHWAAVASEGAIVSFSNIRTSEPATFQVCKTERLTSVCCEPFDIEMDDGRGYGWFRAELVSFAYVEPQTQTAIYGRHSQRTCSTNLVAKELSGLNWQMEIPRLGAGSVVVARDPTI